MWLKPRDRRSAFVEMIPQRDRQTDNIIVMRLAEVTCGKNLPRMLKQYFCNAVILNNNYQ